MLPAGSAYRAFRSIVLSQDQLDEAPLSLLPPPGTDLISYVAEHDGENELDLRLALRWDSVDLVWRATAFFANAGGSGEVRPTLSNGVPPAVVFEPADQIRETEGAMIPSTSSVVAELLRRTIAFVHEVEDAGRDDPGLLSPHENVILRDQALQLRDLSQRFSRSLGDQIEGGPSGPNEAPRLTTRRSWLPPAASAPESGQMGL